MALVIIDRNKPDSHAVIRLRDRLREVQELAEYLNAVGAVATDADFFTTFGVPAADAAAFRTVVGNVDTALQAPAIDIYINNLG